MSWFRKDWDSSQRREYRTIESERSERHGSCGIYTAPVFFATYIFFLRKPSSTMRSKPLKILKWVKVPGKIAKKIPGEDFWKSLRNYYNAYNGDYI